MKKIFFVLVLQFAINSLSLYAQEPVPVPVETKQTNGNYTGGHRTPIGEPRVYWDVTAYTLLFSDAMYECCINLVSSSNETVFSSRIPDGADEFQLPSNLSGEFELQIVRGNYMFVGYITF